MTADLRVPEIGLCAECLHASRVTSVRGSAFTLCERSKTDTRYARYPRLPVFACPGFDPKVTSSPNTPRPLA
jgi:hypothetical protein